MDNEDLSRDDEKKYAYEIKVSVDALEHVQLIVDPAVAMATDQSHAKSPQIASEPTSPD